MLELLAPAGSPEGVVAAVQNGADAVFMGFGDFNARRNAKNFSEEDFYKAAEYCRVRGVKVYATLNTLASDREFSQVMEAAKCANRCGADAILVQDLGVLRAVRHVVPDMPVHASTQMTIHNLEGVKFAAAMGIKRVVLSRELSCDEIAYICEKSPIEIEVFAHGALCMCYSGQCYMSAVIGRRSGNRGMCAQPCRLNYSMTGNGNNYPLSLKDNCLINYLNELETIGVTSLKIEGRMKRPEYAAIVTGIYSRAIKERTPPTDEEMQMLKTAFSRQGFTDGYYTGKKGREMFGVREEADKGDTAIFATARKQYLNAEVERIPVHFVGVVKKGERIKFAVADDCGNTAVAEGPVPEDAFNREITPAIIQTQLCKTGGTPFTCEGIKSDVEPGLAVPLSAINEMRRTLLQDLAVERGKFRQRAEGTFEMGYRLVNSKEAPALTVSVLKADQLSKRILEAAPQVVYIPLEEVRGNEGIIRPFIEHPDITPCLILPKIIHDKEKKEVEKMLRHARGFGFRDVLVSNIGHILFAKGLGFNVRGDYGLNIYNSQTLKVFKEIGLKSATLSFEMRLEQIRDISKTMDSEIIVYGRLPLMVTENCIIKSGTGVCSCDKPSAMTDRNGFKFPIVKEFGCRSVVLNSKKLFLADRAGDYLTSGLWGVRLAFTTENAIECANIVNRYLNLNDYEPSSYTRGLYYRGVE